MPKVTVIIPVYKTEKYLPECMDSVLGQTLKDIEIIAVDDHSPDRCGEILDQYAAADSRVRVFHLEVNSTQGYGRNLGLDNAEGKYVYFLDSDDMLAKNALEVLYAKAEELELDGIFFDAEVIFENEALEKKFKAFPGTMKAEYEDRVFEGVDFYNQLITNDDWTCYVQKQFWKRSFLIENEVRSPVRSAHEDEVFAFEAILLAKRIYHLPEKFFIRRFRENSVMTVPASPDDFYGYLVCFYEMTLFLNKHGLKTEYTDINLGRMYFLTQDLYRRLKDQYDLKQWLLRPEIRNLFELYESSRDVNEAYFRKYISACLEEVEKHRKVWIYGAGLIGTRVYQALAANKIAIEGFLVTGREGNPHGLFGRPITPIDEFDPAGEDVIVVVGVSVGYRPEIEEILDKRGIPHIYYK